MGEKQTGQAVMEPTSPQQAGLGPGCHEGPASALLQASAKPEPRLHVNTSCVKTAQLLLGQQTAVGLLGNRLAPPTPRLPSHCLYLQTLCRHPHPIGPPVTPKAVNTVG